MGHSKISPSSAHRWVKCPASVPLAEDYPDEETEAAREGTAAHELAEKMLNGASRGLNTIKPENTIGTLASNGVLIDKEMYEACEGYTGEIGALMITTGVFRGPNMGIEAQIHAPKIHEESYGTCDFWLFDSKNFELHVYDFKYGMRYVCAAENWQLINYVCGLLDKVDGLTDQRVKVNMHIYQPRAYGYDTLRTWSVMASDLCGYYNILHAKAHEAFSLSPSAESGPHCHNCAAILDCETNKQSFFNAIDVTQNIPNIIATDAEALGRMIAIGERAKDAIETRLEAMQAQGLQLALTGTPPHGYTVGHGRGSTTWAKDDEEVLTLGDLMNIDLRRVKPCTPKQAIEAGLDAAVVDAYSTKKSGAAKLVPVNLSKIKEDLSK